jgi:hypothetical protein
MKRILKFLAMTLALLAWKPRIALANIAEGTHEGSITRLTDAAVATRYLLATVGSDAAHAAICAANGIPIGVFTDEAAAAEANIAIELLGVSKRTLLVVASEAITAGEHVYTAADGKVQDLPTVAGTYYEVGVALTAASGDGVLLEVAHCVPRKTVVT